MDLVRRNPSLDHATVGERALLYAGEGDLVLLLSPEAAALWSRAEEERDSAELLARATAEAPPDVATQALAELRAAGALLSPGARPPAMQAQEGRHVRVMAAAAALGALEIAAGALGFGEAFAATAGGGGGGGGYGAAGLL